MLSSLLRRGKRIRFSGPRSIRRHWLINFINYNTKAKCRQLNNLPVTGLCGRCLLDFVDWSGDTVSHVGISDPVLWTVAPLTFFLVSTPPPFPVWISILIAVQCWTNLIFNIIHQEKHHHHQPSIERTLSTSPSCWKCRGCPFQQQHQQQYGCAGCIPFHCQQYGCRVFPFSLPAVWMCKVHPFPLPAVWVKGVSLFTASSMNVQGASLPTASSMGAGCFPFHCQQRLYDTNGIFQMQGGKNRILPK